VVDEIGQTDEKSDSVNPTGGKKTARARRGEL
jgi:hypothetical protein